MQGRYSKLSLAGELCLRSMTQREQTLLIIILKNTMPVARPHFTSPSFIYVT